MIIDANHQIGFWYLVGQLCLEDFLSNIKLLDQLPPIIFNFYVAVDCKLD